MKLSYDFRTKLQFLAFAFYPRTTLLVCTFAIIIIVGLLSLAMTKLPTDSGSYNIVFTLATGAIASLFVTIIVELSGNYRHNKLGFYELADYYLLLGTYKLEKSVQMGNSPHQRVENLARQDAGITESDPFDEKYDDVQATWQMLPKTIPVFKDVYENKKEFLSDEEIESLKSILSDYDFIKKIAATNIEIPFMYESLNHPDEDFLKSIYPQNVLNDMPDHLRKHLAAMESEKAVAAFIDNVFSDEFLMQERFKYYDISEQNLVDTSNDDEDDDASTEVEDWDADEYVEEEQNLSEEKFKARREAENKYLIESDTPWIASQISFCCKRISTEIEKIEKINKGKPYYGLIIQYVEEMENSSDEKKRDNMFYKLENERLKKEKKQNS